MRKYTLLSVLFLMLHIMVGIAIADDTLVFDWQTHLGGLDNDSAYGIAQGSTGDLFVAGKTMSYTNGSTDFLVYRLDAHGNVIWRRNLGSKEADSARAVLATADGGCLVLGDTDNGEYGDTDILLYKISADGSVLWGRYFGGQSYDYGQDIMETMDGGYIVTGNTMSYTNGGYDFWLLKLDSQGNEQWNRHMGSTNDDIPYSVAWNEAGEYFVAGSTSIPAYTTYASGSTNFLVYKLDGQGNEIWHVTLGGTQDDVARAVLSTSDGGCLVLGYTRTGQYGGTDIVLYKLSSSGSVERTTYYGGSDADYGMDIVRNADGTLFIAGFSMSQSNGGYDAYLVKTDENGNEIYHYNFGGTANDMPYAMIQTAPGVYALAGTTLSETNGEEDAWIFEVSDNSSSISYDLTISRNGDGFGVVASTPEGIHCGYDCNASYAEDTVVTLTATPEAGSVFAGWSGDADCADGNVTMDGAKSCTAIFMQNHYIITTSVSPPAGGTVSCSPTPVYHGFSSTCTLAANPGYMVSGAGGTCEGTLVGTIYTTGPVTADCTVTAAFELIPVTQYGLAVNMNGTGSGTVTSSPSGISCGNDCVEAYDDSTVITLSAAPAADSVFSGWSGDCSTCSGNTVCTVTMNASRSCTASFAPAPTPAGRYNDNSNGTVTDMRTGLMWQKADDGIKRNWSTAMSYCETLTLGGYNDWHLPMLGALQSIVRAGTGSPHIDTLYFSCRPYYYWSATQHSAHAALAWGVGFHKGSSDANDKNVSVYARCMRGPVWSASLSAPVLSSSVSGLDLTMSWSTVPGAAGYILSVVPYPFTGLDSILSFDMQNLTHITVTLWHGATYYIVMQSYNSTGISSYSNVEFFTIN